MNPAWRAANPSADPVPRLAGLVQSLESFLAGAFDILATDGLLPRRPEEPWLPDHLYSSPALGVGNATDATRALEAAFPERFAPEPHHRREFADHYLRALIRGAVAWATVRGEPYRVDSPGPRYAIRELLDTLERDGQPALVIRVISSLGVEGEPPPEIHGVVFKPVTQNVEQAIANELPESSHSGDLLWFGAMHPVGLAIDSGQVDDLAYENLRPLRNRIGYALTALRLGTAGTLQEVGEAVGEPRLVHLGAPEQREFPSDFLPLSQRPVRLTQAETAGLGELAARIEAVDMLRGAKGEVSSIVIGLGRFNRSYRTAGWQDVVVDLGIALEAALAAGEERTEITNKLATRAAHLLGSDADSAETVFDHVRILYDLRSAVVHGAAWTEKRLMNRLRRVAPGADLLPGDIVQVVLDRFRDIVRRALLFRLLIAEIEGDNEWSLLTPPDVDRMLVQASVRDEWRNVVAGLCDGFGVAPPWVPASPLKPWAEVSAEFGS